MTKTEEKFASIEKKCSTCNKVFKVFPCREKQARFCSTKCKGVAFKGISVSPNTQIKKGQILSRDVLYKKGDVRITGVNHHLWKGDEVGYFAAHAWIKRSFGKAIKCESELCVYPRRAKTGNVLLRPKRFEWANINHTFSRKMTDYRQLCASCHRQFDRMQNPIKIDGDVII